MENTKCPRLSCPSSDEVTQLLVSLRIYIRPWQHVGGVSGPRACPLHVGAGTLVPKQGKYPSPEASVEQHPGRSQACSHCCWIPALPPDSSFLPSSGFGKCFRREGSQSSSYLGGSWRVGKACSSPWRLSRGITGHSQMSGDLPVAPHRK